MKLNIGCGFKKLEGYLNIDCDSSVKPDRVMNIETDLKEFKDNSIDEILFDNVIEHLDISLVDLILELKRMLKPNGCLTIIASNCFYWKHRIRFLFGSFSPSSGYHFDHRWILKPSFLKDFLVYYGFEVNEVSDLFDKVIKVFVRKRL